MLMVLTMTTIAMNATIKCVHEERGKDDTGDAKAKLDKVAAQIGS